MISREWTTRGVGTVQPWRQADYQQLRFADAEGRHRSGVIIGEFRPHRRQMPGKAWTGCAGWVEQCLISHDSMMSI